MNSELKKPVRHMEYLNRGLVAVKVKQGVYVGWRLMGTEFDSTCFNLYRDGEKVNTALITDSTNYLDPDGTIDSTYYVRFN